MHHSRICHLACAVTVILSLVFTSQSGAQEGAPPGGNPLLPGSPPPETTAREPESASGAVSAGAAPAQPAGNAPTPLVPPANPSPPEPESYEPKLFHRVALVRGATIKSRVEVVAESGQRQLKASEQPAPNYPVLFEIQHVTTEAGVVWYWVVGPVQGWVLCKDIESPEATLRANSQEQCDYPYDPAPYIRRGQIELGRQHWVAAIDAYNAALRLAELRRDPKNPTLYHERALAYMSGDPAPKVDSKPEKQVGPERVVRDYGRALGDLSEELRLNPDSPLGYLERGHVFLLMAEQESGINTSNKAQASLAVLASTIGDSLLAYQDPGPFLLLLAEQAMTDTTALREEQRYHDMVAAICKFRATRDLDRARELGPLVPGIMVSITNFENRLAKLKPDYVVSGDLIVYDASSVSRMPFAFPRVAAPASVPGGAPAPVPAPGGAPAPAPVPAPGAPNL